ncbi:MAG: FAD-binding oxidoreductase [Gemmatimonadales bacterium]
MVVSRDRDVRQAHARDASGLELVPEGVARAASVEDVSELVRDAGASGTAITPAGSQTSMTGASITDRGLLLSLGQMNRILDIDPERRVARVDSGVTIGELNRALAAEGLQFAPDPTSEQDASIGGAIACNASGARSLHYGATRRHVRGLKVVHADGEIASYRRSHPEKNAVGYAAVQDPVDWFVGSEGTLGVVVEAELALVPLPAAPVGLAIPFPDERAALAFVVAARDRAASSASARMPLCLEYFDSQATMIAAAAAGSKWGNDAAALVYLEDDAGADGEVEDLLSYWLGMSEEAGAVTADIGVYQGAQPLREARSVRHAVPATMNERGALHRSEGGRKVSTDWAVPYQRLPEALALSRDAVERHSAPEPVTYGHAGNGHPHQNFIAENPEALRRIDAAIEETLRRVVEMGGIVSAEHGIGKLKRPWLALQLAPRQIALMHAVKNALDPTGMFAPGNLL